MSIQESVGNLSHIISEKQKELHQFHDLRCTQLEALVEERDQLLIESSKRFEQLKDDFQFNLTLIEARDKEIERLEQLLERNTQQYEECETERRELVRDADSLRLQDIENKKKIEQDKINNKVGRAK